MIVNLNGMMIFRQKKKQRSANLSTAEEEFLRRLPVRRRQWESVFLFSGFEAKFPINMTMDIQAAIKQVKSDTSSAQSKPVDIELKFVHYLQAKILLALVYVCTAKMIADILTKALVASRLEEVRNDWSQFEQELPRCLGHREGVLESGFIKVFYFLEPTRRVHARICCKGKGRSRR